MLFRRGDRLYIRLAERWEKWQTETGHYRQRPPIIENFAILGEDSTPLAFEVDSYPHIAWLRTNAGDFGWVMIDPEAFLVKLPAGRCGFEFDGNMQRGQSDRRGGALRGIRNIAYTTNARILQNDLTPLSNNYIRARMMLEARAGDALLLNITPRLGYNRSIPDPDRMIAEAEARWRAWFDAAPDVPETHRAQYDYALWVMRAGLLNQRYYYTREAMTPSKIHYVGVWNWDQCFHAIAYRHLDTRIAEDQLRILIDHQQENGMYPDAIHDEGLVTHLLKPVDADVTKPPLVAWAALKLYEKSGHTDFLEEIYQSLTRNHQWWTRDNLNECGLCEYRHPFSSGLDDSPLFDYGTPVVAPDLNTYIVIQQDSLARIADIIGLPEDAKRYCEDADNWTQCMIDVLWNEELGLFDALHDGKRIPVLTPFALLPMWTGRLSEVMNERLVKHLTDPATFWPDWPVPSVALNDPHFDPDQMWRGPTWPNVNHMFVEALERIGRHELAARLRTRTLEMLSQHPDIYEYYNPLSGAHPPKAAPIFGWSSAVYIDLAIQANSKHG